MSVNIDYSITVLRMRGVLYFHMERSKYLINVVGRDKVHWTLELKGLNESQYTTLVVSQRL